MIAAAAAPWATPTDRPAARHDLVWLWPQAGDGAALRSSAGDEADIVATWIAQGRPVIARTPGPLEVARGLALGLPLPLAEGRRRIAFLADPAEARRREPPPGLEVVGPAAPPAWRGPLASLASDAARIGIEVRVYGSLAWQAITGLAYLRPESDLDLLLRPADRRAVARVPDLLRALEDGTGRRVDGEVILPGELAVAWRELAAGGAILLGRSLDGPRLHPRGELLALLPEGPRG